MKVAAYCRVPEKQNEKKRSLEAQKKFFLEFTEKHQYQLVKIYTDTGNAGTKSQLQEGFEQLLQDAQKGKFQKVIIKDIFYFARNTAGFQENIRCLKALDIDTVFLTADQQILDNSEGTIALLGTLAREESASTSQRVKSGKELNAKKGRVPNVVYGYDKKSGDYFHLEINEQEAFYVRQIFQWYVEEGLGGSKIAERLNEMGVRTKRNRLWSQAAVCRTLRNQIYAGYIVNGKEEVTDFVTGERKSREQSEWMVTRRPKLAIIGQEIYESAQETLHKRQENFQVYHVRQSNKYLFSSLLQCAECGYSFCRLKRNYKTKTTIKWVCGGRNAHGADSCGNRQELEEEELRWRLAECMQRISEKEVWENPEELTNEQLKKEIRRILVNEQGKVFLELQKNSDTIELSSQTFLDTKCQDRCLEK